MLPNNAPFLSGDDATEPPNGNGVQDESLF
jgi:hypothetical protein